MVDETKIADLKLEIERSGFVARMKQGHGAIEAAERARKAPIALSLVYRLQGLKSVLTSLGDTAKVFVALPPTEEAGLAGNEWYETFVKMLESAELIYEDLRNDFARSLFRNPQDAESTAPKISVGKNAHEKIRNLLLIETRVGQMAGYLARFFA